MGRTCEAVVRTVGKGKRWLLPRGSFHSVGKVFLRGSRSNTTRALHTRSPRETEERRHSPCIPRAHSLERERPVSPILATACPTLERGKSWGEIDPPALSCTPTRPQSTLLQPFLSELPLPTPPQAPRPAALARPSSSAERLVCNQGCSDWPTFPSPPGALGAWETFQRWL